MTTHGPDALVSSEEVSPPAEPRHKPVLPLAARRWAVLIAVLFVALIGAAVIAAQRGPEAERRALLRMGPGEERRALFDETQRNTEALCAQAQRDDALNDRCIDSAMFLGGFPECDAECRVFTLAHQRGATR